MSNNKTVNIGSETNTETIRSLKKNLELMGAIINSNYVGPVGSQEIETWDVQIENENISVAIETYMGILISGKPVLIDQIIRNMNAA